MIALLKHIALSTPLAAILALILGVSTPIMWPSLKDKAYDAYDSLLPVVDAESRVSAKLPDEVLITMTIRKHRDCERIGLNAYGRLSDGTATRLNIQRVGAAPNAPLKYVDVGGSISDTWRVWPTLDVSSVLIYMAHVCDGRVVTTKLTEVPL